MVIKRPIDSKKLINCTLFTHSRYIHSYTCKIHNKDTHLLYHVQQYDNCTAVQEDNPNVYQSVDLQLSYIQARVPAVEMLQNLVAHDRSEHHPDHVDTLDDKDVAWHTQVRLGQTDENVYDNQEEKGTG